MKSEWRVTSNLIGGEKMYAAYRLRDTQGVDHAGNREYSGGYVERRDEAQAMADRLNAEEETK